MGIGVTEFYVMTSYWGAGTMIEGIFQSKNVLPAVTPTRQ